MKAVIQRVNRASVTVDGKLESEIKNGLLVLLGVAHADTAQQAAWLADKIIGLRIFGDNEGKMNLSVHDIHGEILVVSQFTLYGDCHKGRRPSFQEAAPPEQARELYEAFVQVLRKSEIPVKTGRFQAHMQVALENDGPVTLILETPQA